jgi:hypothetical protein
MDDVGFWEAFIGVHGDRIEHAHAAEKNCLPEHAVQVAMAEAVRKCGPQDWSRWRFRAAWISVPPVVRKVFSSGRLAC